MEQHNKILQKIINRDDFKKENINKHNLNWPQFSCHLYRILIIEGSGCGKTNALIIHIKQIDDDSYSIVDKIHLYVKNWNEAKYQYLIKKREKMVLKIWKISYWIFK